MPSLTSIRNGVEHGVYTKVVKPIFFLRDPELVHDRVGALGVLLGKNVVGRALTSLFFAFSHPALRQKIHGIEFKNPIGLAAGFDKNARLTQILPHIGFGWMEVGSITARPCAGNPKPRLYRLPQSQALVINYGLMNDGCDILYNRLSGLRFSIPVGTSIAPTNDSQNADLDKAINDYVYSYKKLATTGSYTTLNLSCPNTCHQQPFLESENLDALLEVITRIKTKKPLFIKLSPDLSNAQLDGLLEVAAKWGVDGVICTNLTKNRDNPALKEKVIPMKGGISGKAVQASSDAMIAHIAREWGGTFTIVGCGGVFSAEDAYRKIRAGASLIQMITGMIYEGPQVISQINEGLVKLLQKDGFVSISEAVGADHRK